MEFQYRHNFSSETAISTSQRILVIIQLCIAFSLILWYLFQPFMGEYFALRSRMLLYEYVIGNSEILKTKNEQNKKLKQQAEHFQKLPLIEQELLMKDYQTLQNYAKRPIYQKILEGLQFFLKELPPFEQAWLFFSVTIAILILLRVEGAKQATWLLPLIVLAYSFDNQITGQKPYISPDLELFPSETTLIQNYLNKPLSFSLSEQKKQLEQGWNNYLIKNWSKTSYNNESQRLKDAEFHFTLARLHRLHNQPYNQWLKRFHEKINPLELASFLIWNTLFAWIISRKREKLLYKPFKISKLKLIDFMCP